jgi:hypothetical protein
MKLQLNEYFERAYSNKNNKIFIYDVHIAVIAIFNFLFYADCRCDVQHLRAD